MSRRRLVRALAATLALGLAAAACTHAPAGASGGPSTGGGSPPPASAMCADWASVQQLVPPMLERIDAGTETPARLAEDELLVDALARQLNRDVAPFANPAGARVFSLFTGLAADLFHSIYGEPGLYSSVDQIQPVALERTKADLRDLRSAIADGTLPCPAGG